MRRLTILSIVLLGVVLLAGSLVVRTARSQGSWQDKVDPTVLQAAAAGETEFLVYFAEQADLSGAAALRTKAEKGAYVVQRLQATAERSQPAVRQQLEQLGAPYQAFWFVNTIWARGNLSVVQAVALRPEVAAIYPSPSARLELPPEPAESDETARPNAAEELEWNIALVKADQAWELGARGQGVVVAGADTGVHWTHEALKEKYRGWNGSEANHDYNWHDAIHTPTTIFCPADSPQPCDDDEVLGGGHGTHTMGTMVGSAGANQIGMAPDAEWIACRNMHNGVGLVPTYMECMQWFMAPTPIEGGEGDPTKAPHVINNSWACLEACPPAVLRQGTQAIRAAGIVYVASAGNDGPECSTIEFPPARYPESFTVGATNNQDVIADFSSRGPVIVPEDPSQEVPYRKPDISAPGVNVRSSLKGTNNEDNDNYDDLDGTSMAGPHVAGLVALVISANPQLAGDVDRIEEIIEASAKPLFSDQCGDDGPEDIPNNVYGYGRIDALAAVEMALDDTQATPTATTTAAASTTATASPIVVPSVTTTVLASPTVTVFASATGTTLASPTVTVLATGTATTLPATGTATGTVVSSPTVAATGTATAVSTGTATAIATGSATASPQPTGTGTPEEGYKLYLPVVYRNNTEE